MFVPLTNGLGLESPKRKETVTATTEPVQPVKQKYIFEPADKYKYVSSEKSLAAVMEMGMEVEQVSSSPEVVSHVEELFSESAKELIPPPLPQPSFFRRIMTPLIDELFVLMFWAIAVLITSNVLTGFSIGLSNKVFKEFSNPLFVRFAILEFATIWLAYFMVCLGIIDRTFGMWVWGLRVSYGTSTEGNYALRKMMRVIWSFIFYAPIVPLFLLLFRRRGRNLLDTLSGTNVYLAS